MHLTLTYPVQSGGRFFTRGNVRGYCFGFNGKERDDEGMGGGGSTYDYGFRIYNPQIAKFLSVDPLTHSYPWYTPYQFAGNKPIAAIDLDGLEEDYKYNAYFAMDETSQSGLSRVEAQQLYQSIIRSQKFLANARDKDVAMGVGLGIALGLGISEGPAVYSVLYRAVTVIWKSPVGKYFRKRTKDAIVDFTAQLFAEGDIEKVDWTGVAANYATPFKGSTGFILNNTLKNSLDAVVDLSIEKGLQYAGGDGDENKSVNNVAVDFFVGQVVDNLAGAYKSYLVGSGLDEKSISKKVKDFGMTVKEYLDNRIKNEMGKTGKDDND